MDSYCDAYTLSEHVALRTCQVYSSRLVKDQEWYKRTEKITWSPYFSSIRIPMNSVIPNMSTIMR